MSTIGNPDATTPNDTTPAGFTPENSQTNPAGSAELPVEQPTSVAGEPTPAEKTALANSATDPHAPASDPTAPDANAAASPTSTTENPEAATANDATPAENTSENCETDPADSVELPIEPPPTVTAEATPAENNMALGNSAADPDAAASDPTAPAANAAACQSDESPEILAGAATTATAGEPAGNASAASGAEATAAAPTNTAGADSRSSDRTTDALPGAPSAENDDQQSKRASKRAAALRGLLHRSVVAGESASDFHKVLDGVSEEMRPQRLREWFLAEQISYSEQKARRLRAASALVWNAGIAKSIHRQIVDIEAVELLAHQQEKGLNLIQTDKSVEGFFSQEWWRRVQNEAFAAVSGDKEALEIIEDKLGRGTIALNVFTDFAAIMASEIQIDRCMAGTLTARDNAYKQLDKIAAQREKKNKKRKRDKAPPSQGEGKPVSIDVPTTAASEAQTVEAPRPDSAKEREDDGK
jgi:hypothetical protein